GWCRRPGLEPAFGLVPAPELVPAPGLAPMARTARDTPPLSAETPDLRRLRRCSGVSVGAYRRAGAPSSRRRVPGDGVGRGEQWLPCACGPSIPGISIGRV